MAEELSKKELMKRRREENKQEVRAVVTYECGACGHAANVEVRPDEHGLIFVPTAYCGSCAKSNNFRIVSGNVTKIEVKTKKEWDEIDHPKEPEEVAQEPEETASNPEEVTPAPEETDEPETGAEQADVPEKKASKTKRPKSVDED